MAAPSPPLSLVATSSDAQVTLSWTTPASDGGNAIANYSIYRGTSSGTEALLITIGDLLSYTDTGLLNGQTYYYAVTATNGIGESAWSDETSAVPRAVPSEPRGPTAASGNARVTLTWSAPSSNGGSSITGFKVYRGTTSGTEFQLVVLGNVLTYVDTGLANGQTYYYVITAVNAVGEGPRSGEVSSTPDSVPTPPRGFTAIASNLAVGLNWTAPSYVGPGTITYHLYRDGSLVWSGTAIVHFDSPLIKGVQHSYQVSASNSLGRGQNCTVVQAASFGVPDALWGLKAVSGNGQVSLSWKLSNYTGPGTLTCYLFCDGDIVWSGTTSSHLVSSLVNGRAYEFKVAASNGVGWSANSTSRLISPEGPPTTPFGLHAVSDIGKVTLNWSAPVYVGPGALIYYLYRDGTLIWNGTMTTYVDLNASGDASHDYKVAARNSLGTSTSSTAVQAVPLPEEDLSEPFILIAIVGLVIIGMIPLLVILHQRSKKRAPAPEPVQDLRCPRCGATHSSDSKECPNCSLEFSK